VCAADGHGLHFLRSFGNLIVINVGKTQQRRFARVPEVHGAAHQLAEPASDAGPTVLKSICRKTGLRAGEVGVSRKSPFPALRKRGSALTDPLS